MKTLIPALALCFCTLLAAQERTEAATYASTDLDVFEAVFRHLFDNNASAGKRNVSYFFLRIEKEDPSEEFLKRFEEEVPKVLPASKSRYEKGKGILHIEDGMRGLVFRIDVYKKVDEEKYEMGSHE